MVTTQRTILVGIIITLNILFTCFAQPEETLFQLILTRRSGNVITFMCRDTATAQPIPDALYFLNGTRLDNFTTLISGASNEGVTFQINRELEGHFTCGNDSLKSNSMSLISKQFVDLDRTNFLLILYNLLVWFIIVHNYTTMCICIHSCMCAHTYKHNVIIILPILNL